jgi:hypothetical protein
LKFLNILLVCKVEEEPEMKTKLLAIALAATLNPSLAEAKSARCFTTDDGYFPCEFTATDKAGSFEIRSLQVRGAGYSIIV